MVAVIYVSIGSHAILFYYYISAWCTIAKHTQVLVGYQTAYQFKVSSNSCMVPIDMANRKS